MSQSIKNQQASANNPILKRGGPSSSDILNRCFNNIGADLTDLYATAQDLDRRERILALLLSNTATGIGSFVHHLETLLPAAPAGRGLADFYGLEYVASHNTATIDPVYGVATLPVLSTQEKLSGIDSSGNIWVPDDSRIRTYTSIGYMVGTLPTDDSFQSSVEDYLGIGAQPDRFFLGGRTPDAQYAYMKLVLPQTLSQNALSNRLTFVPVPVFTHILVDVYIRNTAGVWSRLDITYLPGYVADVGVTFVGPTQMYFAPQEITEVCLVLKVDGWWGLSQAGVQLVEYGVAATLAVDLSPYTPGTYTTAVLYGINPAVLNQYPVTYQDTEIQIPLVQSQGYTTPVVTAVEGRW